MNEDNGHRSLRRTGPPTPVVPFWPSVKQTSCARTFVGPLGCPPPHNDAFIGPRKASGNKTRSPWLCQQSAAIEKRPPSRTSWCCSILHSCPSPEHLGRLNRHAALIFHPRGVGGTHTKRVAVRTPRHGVLTLCHIEGQHSVDVTVVLRFSLSFSHSEHEVKPYSLY